MQVHPSQIIKQAQLVHQNRLNHRNQSVNLLAVQVHLAQVAANAFSSSNITSNQPCLNNHPVNENPEIEKFSDSCGQMHDASEQDNRFLGEASSVFSSNEGETNSRLHSKNSILLFKCCFDFIKLGYCNFFCLSTG